VKPEAVHAATFWKEPVMSFAKAINPWLLALTFGTEGGRLRQMVRRTRLYRHTSAGNRGAAHSEF
jgi:hypothetical protein